jgi:hypothetical protein
MIGKGGIREIDHLGVLLQLGINYDFNKVGFVALSTTKTMYIAVGITSCKSVWLHNLLKILHPDMMQKGIVKLQYISTYENIVDHMRHDTEGSSEAPISIDQIGVMHNVSLTEREC